MVQITIKDIAEASGVSPRIAAEVLRSSDGKGKVRFSETTKHKVLDTAERLHYRPNRAARSLRRQQQGAIGLYVGDSIFSVCDLVLNNLLRLCRDEGLAPIIELSPKTSNDLPVSLREHSVDGIIVFEEMARQQEAPSTDQCSCVSS